MLIVEDDFAMRSALASTLAAEGYAVTCAANGREAFEIICSCATAPEVIILDLCMPKMNGIEFCSLKMSVPSRSDIPVVIVTGAPIREQELAALGVRTVLRKPFGADDMLRALERMMT